MSENMKVKHVIKQTVEVGDKCVKKFNKTSDLGAAKVGLDAYKTAVRAAKAQIMYKRLTAGPKKIKFFED
jgi:hypothetical protein